MEDRVAARPEWRHGAHTYSAADFGLAEEEIREQFGSYVEDFGLLAARSPA
jgi:hypothetical protein